MASMVVNALAPHVVRGARMGLHWAAPRASAALNKTVEASHAARDFVRELAVEKFDGLTEAEYRDVVHHESSGDSKTEPNLIDFSDGEADELVTASKGDREQVEDELKTEPRRIRLHCRNIRASRDIPHMEALGAMTPRFSHWCVEVDGLFCELRAANPGNSLDFKSDDGRIVEHQELGEVNRKIKLGITTNRQMHANARSYDVGNTILHNQQIIKIASLIFRRFSQSYDLWLDNCQLFCQLLAETIGGKENVAQVRRILDQKSVMKLPVAASWLTGPAYHFMAVVHHTLPKVLDSHECKPGEFCADCSLRTVHRCVDNMLENCEKFYYHPRVYGSRETTSSEIEAKFKKLNPFL